MKKLEERKLNYLGRVAKNRKVIIKNELEIEVETSLEELALNLPPHFFQPIILNTDFVATFKGSVSRLEEERTFAIVINASSVEKATDIDYFITNFEPSKVTPELVVKTYSQRNWIEVFDREAKGWLGLKKYQVRDKWSMERHLIEPILC